MKLKIDKSDFILLGKMTVMFIFLVNSAKFFSFFFDSLSFSYASFVLYTPKFEGKPYESLIANYHNILYTLNIVYLSTFLFFLIILFSSYKKRKISTINYILIIVILILIFKFYRNFTAPNFYGIIPLSLFDSLKLYLFTNGLLFIIGALLLYFFTFGKFFFKNFTKGN